MELIIYVKINIIGLLLKGRLLEFDYNFFVKLINIIMKGKVKKKKLKFWVNSEKNVIIVFIILDFVVKCFISWFLEIVRLID